MTTDQKRELLPWKTAPAGSAEKDLLSPVD